MKVEWAYKGVKVWDKIGIWNYKLKRECKVVFLSLTSLELKMCFDDSTLLFIIIWDWFKIVKSLNPLLDVLNCQKPL